MELGVRIYLKREADLELKGRKIGIATDSWDTRRDSSGSQYYSKRLPKAEIFQLLKE